MTAPRWKQIECDQCNALILVGYKRVELYESIWKDGINHKKVVAHYCWDCYKKMFYDVIVKNE